MRIKIIKKYLNDSIQDFEFKVNKFCEAQEKLNRTIIDVQIIHEESLIAVVKYE